MTGPASAAASSPMSICAGQEQMEEDFYSLLGGQEGAGSDQGDHFLGDQDDVIRRALASAPRDLPPPSTLTTPQRRTGVPPMTPVRALPEKRVANPAPEQRLATLAAGSAGGCASGTGKAVVGTVAFQESPVTPAALDPYMSVDGAAPGAVDMSAGKTVSKRDGVRHGIKHGATPQHPVHAPNSSPSLAEKLEARRMMHITATEHSQKGGWMGPPVPVSGSESSHQIGGQPRQPPAAFILDDDDDEDLVEPNTGNTGQPSLQGLE